MPMFRLRWGPGAVCDCILHNMFRRQVAALSPGWGAMVVTYGVGPGLTDVETSLKAAKAPCAGL
jgi:hypothetical protein